MRLVKRCSRYAYWGWKPNTLTPSTFSFRGPGGQSQRPEHLFPIALPRAPFFPIATTRAPFVNVRYPSTFASRERDPSTFFRSQRPEHLCPIRIPRAPFRKVLGLSLLQRPKHLFSNRNDPSTFAKGAHASAIGRKVLGWWRLQQPEHLFMGQKILKRVLGVCTLEKRCPGYAPGKRCSG